MKCQLNALEILANNHLKITVKPDEGETITKDFFFFKEEGFSYIALQEVLSP